MSHSRWQAPREDGAVLVVPPWDDLPGLVEENSQLVKQSPIQLGGHSLVELRQQAAMELTVSCEQYAAQRGLGVPQVPLTHRPVIAVGHQPELYHPGVLVKNFAAGSLANVLGGVGFNLTVDSDVAKETGLKLPVTADDHFVETLHFSAARPPLPYEEWFCDDEGAYSQLPEQAQLITRNWPWRPVLAAFWEKSRQAADTTRLIPERWLVARHQLEAEWGITNYELPMSWLCRSDCFGFLFGHFVERRAELAAIHNAQVAAFRVEHRIRSRSHPAADLEVAGDSVELPFWAWQPGTTQRGRVCAQPSRGGVEFTVVLPDRVERIPGTWPGEMERFRASWPEMLATGWKIRPKALVTTMMMRLLVADLFVHGIGGAVYDELTDRIFSRFFDSKLPRFAVATATLRLPWGERPIGEEEERRLRQTLRTLYWNPDRLLSPSLEGRARHYVELKQQLLRQPPTSDLRERHRHFEEVREHLHPYVADQERQTETALHEAHRLHRRDEHRFSREHAWILYPEQSLLFLRNRFGQTPSLFNPLASA